MDPEDWNWSSAKAHIRGIDDGLVKAKPMLDRTGDWRAYLGTLESEIKNEQIGKHTRTGRSLDSSEFIQSLENLTGMDLTLGHPGRRPLKG